MSNEAAAPAQAKSGQASPLRFVLPIVVLAMGLVAWELVVRTGAEKEGRVAILEALTADQKVIIKPPPGLPEAEDGVHERHPRPRVPSAAGSVQAGIAPAPA